MRITRPEITEKLTMLNRALDKRGLPRYGFDYNTIGRGVYRLMHLHNFAWKEATDWMSINEIWHYMDGMLSLLIIMEG